MGRLRESWFKRWIMPEINNFTPEQQAIVDKLWPHITRMLREINNAGDGLCFTGFLYGGEEGHPMLVHISNIKERGPELIAIHYTLAKMAMTLEGNRGASTRLELDSAPDPFTPEEVADKLAIRLMQVGFNVMDEETGELLQQYLEARKPLQPKS